MTLRRRTFLLVSGAIFSVLLLGLLVVDALVGRALHDQLDSALLTHARTEAASSFDRPGGLAHVHEGGVASRSGALTKYAAIYDLKGKLQIATKTFAAPPPADPRALALCARGGDLLQTLDLPGMPHLRGVWVPAPEPVNARAVVLLAVPDEMVAQVRLQLRSAAALTAICGLILAFAVARLLASRLTRGTEAIAAAAKGVAAGDLSRRVSGPIPDEEIAGLGRDLNDMIERLARLLQAQRRFTSDAAHELRSPLTALRGQLEVTLRQPRRAEQYLECLESCLDDVERLSAMTEDLLALARLEGRPARGTDVVDVRAVVQETLLRQAEVAAAAGVELALLPGSTVQVRGDALQLSRLLRNLLENAVRVSQHGRAPHGEEPARPPLVEVAVLPAEGRGPVRLQVLDRGPGIPQAVRGRLFEPFMRLDEGRSRAHGGTGLGLPIAREIARVHGGDLRYDDRPGGGAIFTATLDPGR